ncbi:uncharacterized protein LOC133533001 [Cydia pomonella]|uniref:uncharacterized protein LOC133533001 n=1 Tax=Cydia pomonella TaxID=82600 RepID=UPI002ADD81FC|nr:uncharacterized protein LOC133533001 [Cydia pomonella]
MLFRIYLLSFLLHFTTSRVNKRLKISCGLDEVSRDSVAMRFYVQIENTGNDCKVECIPGRCCTEQGDEENCDVLKLFGGCLQNVPSGESRTVRLAAPLLDPLERRGFCVVHVNSKLKDHPLYRDTVTIPFDTGRPSDVTPCARIDQDALNDCQPVNCETYYNGHKPHFSKRLKRCIPAVTCAEDDIYDEDLNRCVSPITDDDIIEIESLSNRKMRSSNTNKEHKKAVFNTTKTSKEVTKSDLDIAQKIIENYNVHKLPIKFLDSLKSPKILICVICVQCCFVLLLAFYIRDKCHCVSKDKEVLNKFFNNRQEDSITTPLISASHATVTTCQFQTDSSSNIDRKIKFYKACQDKRAKASMSDDILSRCLKRRDWIAKPKSSEVIQSNVGIQVYDTEKSENEKTSNKQDILPALSSEQQVKCFEYEPHNFYTRYVTSLQRTHSLAENSKNVQASFPKDSIDDFLSERGRAQSHSISGSSRTSKNNLDTVLSLLSQKIGPLSEPGSEDLELLHMSRASVYSSSNASDYEMKRIKESRSSL